jgi:hypothetical protein
MDPMDQSINVTIPTEVPSTARLIDLLVRLAMACRSVGARARLGPADETVISRSSGGRC